MVVSSYFSKNSQWITIRTHFCSILLFFITKKKKHLLMKTYKNSVRPPLVVSSSALSASVILWCPIYLAFYNLASYVFSDAIICDSFSPVSVILPSPLRTIIISTKTNTTSNKTTTTFTTNTSISIWYSIHNIGRKISAILNYSSSRKMISYLPAFC